MTIKKKDILRLLEGDVNIIVVTKDRLQGATAASKNGHATNGDIVRPKQLKFICKTCKKHVYRLQKGDRVDLRLCHNDAPKIQKVKRNKAKVIKRTSVTVVPMATKELMEKVAEIAPANPGMPWEKLVEKAVGATA